MENRRILLTERPRYIVPSANCFTMDRRPVAPTPEGGLRLRTTWLSMDVMLYARVQHISAQAEPVKLGEVMVGPTIGRVEESRHPKYKAGELLSGFWGWQDYAISDGSRLRKLDFGVQKPSYALGAYGASGFGAYIALTVLARPAAGETVVVGTATGGLGQIAGQIAKLRGCRVVGIAGGPEKCQLAVEKLGFDACLDHQADDLAERVKAACPEGIDVYVETIGGKVLDAVLPMMKLKSCIVACGLMGTPHYGESTFKGKFSSTMQFMNEIINRRIEVRGLVVFDYTKEHLQGFQRDMKSWIDAGQIKPFEDIVDGLENAPDAFQRLFEGTHRGKLVVKVAAD